MGVTMRKWISLLMVLLLGVGISGVHAFTSNYNNGVLTIIAEEGEGVNLPNCHSGSVSYSVYFDDGTLRVNVTSSGQIQINVTIEDTSGNPVFQKIINAKSIIIKKINGEWKLIMPAETTKAPIPPIAIALTLIAIPIIALRKYNY